MFTAVGMITIDRNYQLQRSLTTGADIPAQFLGSNPGGKAANTAAWAAAAGCPTTLVTAIGDEMSDELLVRTLAASPLTLISSAISATPEAMILLDPDGERTIIFVASDREAPEPSPASLAAIEQASHSWIHIRDNQHRARYHAVNTGLIGLPVEHLRHEHGQGRHWDFAVGSQADCPRPTHDMLDELALGWCVMTAGASGGEYWQRDQVWQSFTVSAATEIRDACGAGDAFLGGLIAALVAGNELEEAIIHGAASGRAAVSQLGAWPLVEHSPR